MTNDDDDDDDAFALNRSPQLLNSCSFIAAAAAAGLPTTISLWCCPASEKPVHRRDVDPIGGFISPLSA